jgi:hypothetical protein
MKLTIPEELQHHFRMIMRSAPLLLRERKGFEETALVYLKLGGLGLARYYIEISKKALQKDPLEIGITLRFPKMVEAKLTQNSSEVVEKDEADDDDQNEADDEDLKEQESETTDS